MRRVTFRGSGQLNGPVIINKTLEFDDRTASTLSGPKKNEVILAILAIHYPGVKIDPKKIGYESIHFSEKNATNKKEIKTRNNFKKEKKSFSLTNILLWILFFPFKAVWWLLKLTWKDDKY